MAFPTTHTLPGFPMIARFPVDEWERANAPCFTLESWYKLAMKISRQDLANFHHVFELCENELSKL